MPPYLILRVLHPIRCCCRCYPWVLARGRAIYCPRCKGILLLSMPEPPIVRSCTHA